jgi:hypothetical protein
MMDNFEGNIFDLADELEPGVKVKLIKYQKDDDEDSMYKESDEKVR